MNKIDIFLQQSAIVALKLVHRFALFVRKLFGRKTILFVSKQKIKSYSISPAMQVIFLCALLWLSGVFINSARYHSVIKKKSAEIVNLQKANQQFEAEVESLNMNLQKINTYFSSVSGYETSKPVKTEQDVNAKIKEIFGNTSMNDRDKEIATKIADSNLILNDIKGATVKRINDLEQKIAVANIVFDDGKVFLKKAPSSNGDQKNIISLNNKKDLTTRQGGPFQQLRSGSHFFNAANFIFGKDNHISIKDEVEYLANLEKFIHQAPFSAPMKNYYVSSGFGEREDPLKNTEAKHNGMDFAGAVGSKIISPSAGKVIFAGKFGSYGNMVIIDHGYGLTTRYGHLSRINVNRGDVVSKSQIIAVQGTTGRSTGPHLHYEVRYKNIPLNPKRFLQAGQEIYEQATL